MLNIGPRANGDVPYEIEQRLLEIGEWLEINGESIYGAEAFELDGNMHDWGKITAKRAGNMTRLYLHVYNWPLNRHLPLTGITDAPDRVYLLADKQQQPLPYTHDGAFTDIALPALQPDRRISTVVAEYAGTPGTVQGLAGMSTDGGYSLTCNNQSGNSTVETERKSRGGTVPSHAVIRTPQRLAWRIYVDKAGDRTVDVSYSYQGKPAGGKITCLASGAQLTHAIEPTGKTVGEPNSNWIVDRFLSHRLGTVHFPKAGIYELELEIAPARNSEVGFQWIWLK
jgi:alpha-L-fucosidase